MLNIFHTNEDHHQILSSTKKWLICFNEIHEVFKQNAFQYMIEMLQYPGYLLHLFQIHRYIRY